MLLQMTLFNSELVNVGLHSESFFVFRQFCFMQLYHSLHWFGG